MLRSIAALTLMLGALQTAPSPPPALPRHIPAPGGEVVLTTPFDAQSYDQDHLAAVRRAGDFLFLSGAIAGAAKPIGPAEFEERLNKLFTLLEAKLHAGGASFADVVSIRSYHVWNSPNFLGTPDQHNAAFAEVKDRFVKPPYPAWTAIGVERLFGPSGIVEIELTAYAPRHRGGRR